MAHGDNLSSVTSSVSVTTSTTLKDLIQKLGALRYGEGIRVGWLLTWSLHRIHQVFVVDNSNKPIGLLFLSDVLSVVINMAYNH